MPIIIIFIVAISLSMDAFSLSLAYGTLNFSKRDIITISLTVGIFHFFMPLLGYKIGNIILSLMVINPNILTGIIFIFLGIEMLFSVKKEEVLKEINSIYSRILFAFTVSIDSFLVGISINSISNNIYLCGIIFLLFSFFFTYIGLNFGKKAYSKYGGKSIIIGGSILIILGVKYIV